MFIPALLFSVSYLSSAVANVDGILPKYTDQEMRQKYAWTVLEFSLQKEFKEHYENLLLDSDCC